MKLSIVQAAIGSASVLLSAQPVSANLGHRHAHAEYARRHGHGHGQAGEVIGAPKVAARKASCSLPDDPDLVYVPGKVNNGFAMSPDEPCEDGKWCPVACVPGKVMAQWKPHTKQVYPESMYGGIYCNGGEIDKPFDGPYCVDGTGAVKAVNKAGKIVSFCQTVLPGNEAMIIPTDVTDTATLAVPGPDYWEGTSAHYYVNAPGISAAIGCIWGSLTKALGNWSPYVAGANTMANGDTFVKIAWNPEFLKQPLAKITPSYGLKIECPDGGCNGLPCAIDPSKGGVGSIESSNSATSVGGDSFCVVTVSKGKTANIVVFNTDGSQGGGGGGDDDSDSDSDSDDEPEPTTKVPEPPKTTSRAQPTTTIRAPPTSSPSPSPSPSSKTKAKPTPSSAAESTSSEAWYGGIFQEQDVQGETTFYSTPSPTAQAVRTPTPDAVKPAAANTSSNEGAAAAEGGSAIAGLVVALVAAAALI
ncbi:hypothetical protein B0I37DRAFT_75947 [Chaetomium sp. MPI-CAGE-AT-0009]|nr:hypothetical protein B0I37DRAFT_75947 [Chaetomium sp. MPI-CAGE-AT-0009]